MSERHAVADDAADWFLRLQDPAATSQTYLNWQQWLNASVAHREAYDRIEETVLRLKRLAVKPPLPSDEERAQDIYDGSRDLTAWKQAQTRPSQSWHRYA